MATTREDTDQQTTTILPPEEARAFFDRTARKMLNMSGEEFIRRWEAGEYRDLPDTPETRNIMWVAYLIPFGRR